MRDSGFRRCRPRNDGVGLQSYCPNKHIAPGPSLMQGLFPDANYVLVTEESISSADFASLPD